MRFPGPAHTQPRIGPFASRCGRSGPHCRGDCASRRSTTSPLPGRGADGLSAQPPEPCFFITQQDEFHPDAFSGHLVLAMIRLNQGERSTRYVRLLGSTGRLADMSSRRHWRLRGTVTLVGLAATIVAGSDILVEGVYRGPARGGFLDVLARMGASVEQVERGTDAVDLRVRASRLRATAAAAPSPVARALQRSRARAARSRPARPPETAEWRRATPSSIRT